MKTQRKQAFESAYSAITIKKFLQDTKGLRMRVDFFFPDFKLFLDSIRFYMRKPSEPGQPGFTDQEVFRLRKMVLKIKNQHTEDD